MRYAVAWVALVGAAVPARADEVVLRNGARFEGKVKENGDTVTVVMDFGSMTFRKMDVARIDRSLSPLAEFDAKVGELKADDLEGKFRLAIWARQKELHHRSRNLLEDVMARDPDHGGAREALGFRRHKGRWLTEDEIKREQGLVLYQGGWMRREAAEELQRIEAEREAERLRAWELEELRVRAAEAEAAARRAEAEAEAARAQAAYDDYYYYRRPIGFFYGGFPACRTRTVHLGNTVVTWPVAGKGGFCRPPKGDRCGGAKPK